MRKPTSLMNRSIRSEIFAHVHRILDIPYKARDIYFSDTINYVIYSDDKISWFNYNINKHCNNNDTLMNTIHNMFKHCIFNQINLKFVFSLSDSILKVTDIPYYAKAEFNGITLAAYQISDNKFIIHLISNDSTLDVSEEYTNMYKMFIDIVNSGDIKIITKDDLTYHALYALCMNDSDFISLAWELEDYNVDHTDFVVMLQNFIGLILNDYFSREDTTMLLELISKQDSFITLVNIMKLIRRTVDAIYSTEAMEEPTELVRDKKGLLIELLTERLKHVI